MSDHVGIFERVEFLPCADVVHIPTSCVHSTTSLFMRNLKTASLLYIPLYVAFASKQNPSASKEQLLKAAKDGFKSGLWLTVWIPGFTSLLCAYYNKYGQHSKLATFSAGFVSGFASMELQPTQSPLTHRITMYALNNSIETTWKLLAGSGIVTNIPHGECLVFACSLAYLSYSYHQQPEHANFQKAFGFLEGVQDQSSPSIIHPKLDKALHIPQPFIHSPEGYVVGGTIKAFLATLALKIFISIFRMLKSRLVPVAPQAANPAPLDESFVARNGLMLFLTVGTFLYRLSRIILNKLHLDPVMGSLITGFVAGLSSFFFPSVIVSQFLLSSSIESAWSLNKAKGWIIAPTKGRSILFGLCSAVLLYASVWDTSSLRPSTKRVLNFLSNSNVDQRPKGK